MYVLQLIKATKCNNYYVDKDGSLSKSINDAIKLPKNLAEELCNSWNSKNLNSSYRFTGYYQVINLNGY
jgi:hypothetical protein